MHLVLLLLSCIAAPPPTPSLWHQPSAVIIGPNSTMRFTVAPYAFYDVPYSTRPHVVEVRMIAPRRKGQLPDVLVLSTGTLQGSATIVLPLIKVEDDAGKQPAQKLLVRLQLK